MIMRIINKTLIVLLIITFSSCEKSNNSLNENNNTIENTYGFGLLNKIKGIWSGPVNSTTQIGSFPEWIVDFRPISENQISAKNELDNQNDIFMSFFLVKHKDHYKLAFRNGGAFSGMQRVSYFVVDSVSETSSKSFYRFSEMIVGKKRAHTDILFRNDSIYLKTYTNKYNTLTNPTLHMSWSAKLQDITSCQNAVNQFSFPNKTLTKDFTNTFNGKSESMYFSTSGVPTGDPYPETAQPFLGKTTASFSYGLGFTPDISKKVLLIITTQPLLNANTFNTTNLKFRSRYVIVNANDTNFTFNYMHPGSYYYYALYDHDGNNTINSGDWISNVNTTFILSPLDHLNCSTQINFIIP